MISAGTMSFSQQTSLSPASTTLNGSVSIKTTVTNTGSALSNGVVDLEIYNSAGQQVGQRAFSAQSLGAGQSAPYTWTWTAPAQTAPTR